MKKILPLLVVLALFTACKKTEQISKGSEAQPAAVAKMIDTAASVQPSSEKYRKIFNEVAEAVFGFQWVKDDQNPNMVDVDANELYIPQAIRGKFDIGIDKIQSTDNLKSALARVDAMVAKKRMDVVKKTLDAQKETHLWFDLSTLSEPNQKAAKYLIEASYWVHELYKLQLDKNSEVTSSQMYSTGDPESLQLYERNAAAVCGRYGASDYCSVTPYFTQPKFSEIMWPDGADDKMFEEIKTKSTDLKNDPLLSPFTVVKKKPDGSYEAVAYGKFPPFQKYMEKVAALFEQAADVEGIDPTLSSQLKLQATAFRSDNSKPYFESDEVWGKTTGELEVLAGPYESYTDMFGTKAFFEFALAAEDKAATELISKFLPVLPEVEQQFATLVGTDVYQTREITAIPPLRVVRVIVGSGEMRKAGGPSIAFNLPNIGPMAEEGRPKRVIMANHHEAKYPILRAIAEIALIPEQLVDVDAESFTFDSTFHELVHGIGPQRETKAGDSTVALSLGEFYDGIEEAKANVGGVWAAKVLFDKGIITEDQLRKIRTTYVAGLFRIMRFGAKEAHAMGAALEFSYLYSKGAIEERGDRFAINYDKFQDALNGIVAELGRAEAKGDLVAAKALIEGYPARAPALLEVLAKKFVAAGIPRDVALVYHVNGL